MNNICHVCGRDNNLRKISDGELLEKPKLFATIKLEENAPVPKHVCNTCKIGLEVPCQLQEVGAERKWQAKNETDTAEKSVEAVDEFINDGEEFIKHEELLDDIKIEETQLMPATLDYVQYENVNTLQPSTVAEQQLKVAADDLGTKKRYQCKQCNECFSKIVEFKEHMKIHTTTREVYKCPDCARSYLYKKALKHHISREHKKPDISDKEIATSSTLACHNETQSKKTQPKELSWTHEYSVEFRCDVCGKIFKTVRSFDVHMTVHMSNEERRQWKIGPFPCAYCVKIFKSRSVCRDHQRTHTNERPYKCNRCNESFRTRSAVNTHLRLHVLGRPFECQLCLKRFVRAGNLKVHSLWHEGKYPHYCDICNKGFSAKSRLTLHAKRHEEVAHSSAIVSTVNAVVVKDEDSKKQEEFAEDKGVTHLDRDDTVESSVSKTALSSTLKCHSDMQHEKSKPTIPKSIMSSHEYSLELKCALCGEMFNTERSFDLHMNVHMSNEERLQRKIGPFPCAYCGKIFKRHSKRRDHQRIHTNECPYKCNRCKKSFHAWTAVYMHMHRHTNFRTLKIHSFRHSKRWHADAERNKRLVHKCAKCDRSYYFKSSLTRHIKEHHENSKDGPENATSSSPVCHTETQHGKDKPDRLKIHRWRQEYSVEFKCDVCEKIFKTESSLDDHMNTHVSNGDCPQRKIEKLTAPFACAYCDKIFQHRSKYREHQRTHTNERPYKCNRCNGRFCTQAAVQMHVRRHIDKRPFQCA